MSEKRVFGVRRKNNRVNSMFDGIDKTDHAFWIHTSRVSSCGKQLQTRRLLMSVYRNMGFTNAILREVDGVDVLCS